jgi:TRAP-type mannitol/chloroaromatic compound transport system permease large subunit
MITTNKGVVPFFLSEIVLVGLLILFPALTLSLRRLLSGG